MYVRLWTYVTALTSMYQPVSCGYLQKRPAAPLDESLAVSVNSTYHAPPLLPNSWAVASLPPSLGPSVAASTSDGGEPVLSSAAALGGASSFNSPAAQTVEPPSPVAATSYIFNPALSSDNPLEGAASSSIPAARTTELAPSAAAISIVPLASITSGPGCTRYEPCNLFFQYVSVYYWPQDTPNTACLMTIPSGPAPTSLDIPDIVSPDVYLVFPSIKASDGCHQIGPDFASQTTHLPPGEVSTIAPDGSTQSFNFADLPCPPASVSWDSTKPYAPVIAPPKFLFDLDPAFAGCTPGAYQGKDPPAALANGRAPSPPGPEPHRRAKRGLSHARPHAHVVPWSPQRTA